MNSNLLKTFTKFLFIAMLFLGQIVQSQVVIARQDFETSPATPTLTFTTSNVGSPGTSTGFSTGNSGTSASPTNANLFSEGARGYRIQGPDTGTATAGRTLTFSDVNTTGYTGISLNFKVAGMSIGSTGNGMDTTIDEVLIELSPDGGTTWYQQAKVNSSISNGRWYFGATGSGSRAYVANNSLSTFTTTANVLSGSSSAAITSVTISSLPSVANLKVRISAQCNSVNESWILDDVRVTGTLAPTGPTVTTTSNAGLIDLTEAFLTGTINANGTITDASFEYGTTVAYGSTATASPSSVTGTTTTDVDAFVSTLSLNTLYNYRAVGTVSAVPTYGSNMTFYTLAATPGTVAVDNPQLTTLSVEIDNVTQNGNPAITQYAIQTGTQYVQTDGSLGATAVWQTATTWGYKTVTGLTNSTNYIFRTKARNGDNVETVFGADASETTLTPATVDWCNLQWPTSQTIEEGNTFTVYARVNEPGITDSPGEGTAIDAWIGYSATNGTPDGTWTWVSATYLGDDGANNDEYSTLLGSGITPGTYYYASRFSISGGPFVYGGKNNAIWSSTADNAVLTVNSNLVDYANIQYPASGTITEGMTYDVYAQVYDAGVTNPAGQGAGITAEIGYSTSNVTPDGTWTWLASTYHSDSGNNDEYTVNLSGLAPGTYYYASRFIKTGSTEYVYGGTNGSPWATSGVLTVNALGTPVATAGTSVGLTSFTANWDAVTDATSYELDVYEETTVVASDLFISEYVEGSSNNKYIEIYNGTGAAVDLADYDLVNYTNGSFTEGAPLALSGTLANNTTYVIANNSATVWGGTADLVTSSSVMGYNGNDVIALRYLGTNIDVVGTIGDAAIFAENTTLTRNSGVSSPTTTYSSSDWATSASNTVSDLGSHTFSGGTSTTYVVNALNVGDATSYEVTGLVPETTYHYRVRAVLGGVTSPNSNVIDVMTAAAITSCTWDGMAWSNVTGPTALIDAVIEGNYSVASEGVFTAKSLTINAGVLTIESGMTITLHDALINTLTETAVIIESNGNLVQTSTATNTGDVTVRRSTSALQRLDYVLWSSPVAGQNLLEFSPDTMENRFYTYNSGANNYSAVDPTTTDFTEAAGYLIRMPDTHPATATVWEGTFIGVPNNGDYNVAVASGTYNAVGNPYPTTISADAFIVANSIGDNPATLGDGLYFWRKTNNSATSSYATYTTAGGVANTGGGSNLEPNGTIQVGQGFITKATGTTLSFTNSMKTNNHDNQFLRTEEIERNRIWLNMTGANGIFSQTMVAYMTNATQGIDGAIDGRYINDSQNAITTIVEEQEFAIQGRSLPFEATDVVALGFKANAAGTYTFAIDHTDGLFLNEEVAIFIKDNALNVEHNLRNAPYTFTSAEGVYNTRFEIVYQSTLSVNTPTLANDVIVFTQNNSIEIKTAIENIASVTVFDLKGSLLASQANVNTTATSISLSNVAQQVLIVKIITQNGQTVVRKVIL